MYNPFYRIRARTSRTFLAPNFSVRFRVRLVRQNNFLTFMKWFFSPRFRRKPTFLPHFFGLLSVINDNSTGNSTIRTLQCFRQCCIKLIKRFLPLFGLKTFFIAFKTKINKMFTHAQHMVFRFPVTGMSDFDWLRVQYTCL